MAGEREKLLNLEDTLRKRVVGQEEPIEKVVDAIIRSRAGIKNPNSPIGSFLFLGPTAVECLGPLPTGEMGENINHVVSKAVLENPVHKQGHEHPARSQGGQSGQQHLDQDFALQPFKRIIQFCTPRPTRSLYTAGFPPNPAFSPAAIR